MINFEITEMWGRFFCKEEGERVKRGGGGVIFSQNRAVRKEKKVNFAEKKRKREKNRETEEN